MENIQNFNSLKIKVYKYLYSLLWRTWNFFSIDKIYAGSWSGNETLWRTILDLNHILYFYDMKNKELVNNLQRKVFTIVDGIIIGEGEGPLNPSSKKLGLIVAGWNPVYIDAVCAKMLGYNINRIPLIYNGLYNIKSKFNKTLWGEMEIFYNSKKISFEDVPVYNIKLPKYWKRAAVKMT